MPNFKSIAEELCQDGASDIEIAKALKVELKEYIQTLPAIFEHSGGKDFLVKHTRTIDDLIKAVYIVTLRRLFQSYIPMKNSIPITIIALGSYGREALCVKSDIDIAFIYKDIEGFNTRLIIERMLYLLWDIGLKLGHRVHEVSELLEVSRGDITIKSALLESRFIEGSKFLWAEIENELNHIRRDNPKEFIRAKLEERKDMKLKYPLTMEPNLKEGAGGFRDANTVFWVGKVLFNAPTIKDIGGDIIKEHQYREFRIALEFLYRIRSALHIITGKKEDRLRLEHLPDVAKMLKLGEGYKAQLKLAKLMNDRLRTINLYSRIWIEKMTREITPDFYDYLYKPSIKKYTLCSLIETITKESHKRAFLSHPQLLEMLIESKKPEHTDKKIYEVLSKVFYSPNAHSVLKALSDAKLLGFVIPAMKKVISLPQFDGYHKYTVGKHSLKTLYFVENIEDEFIKEIFESLNEEERRMLKVVALFHDAGKGRKKDHHLVGASIFKVFASKLNMDSELIALGERLIQYHTLMSVTAQREDIYSEKVILSFLSRFSTKKALDLIYILTYADMKGVGTDVYNEFSSRLIRQLYLNAIEALDKEHLIDETAKRMKRIDSLKRSPQFKALPRTLQNRILSIPSNAFFIRHNNSEIINIAKMANSTEDFTFEILNDKFLTIKIVRKHDIDISYILHKLSRLEVVNMEIAKLFGDLKYFKIDFKLKADESDIAIIEDIIRQSFQKRHKINLTRPQIHTDEIITDCEHSKEYASMKIKTKDQKGLLAYLIHIFDRYGIDIASAKIHTIKSKANDLFLIEKNGNFCHNIELIIKNLTESVCVE